MAIKISELLQSISEKEMKLVAGKKGINNIVRWVHMVEHKDITFYLKGQEVAIITGIALEKAEDLFDLVKRIYNNDASGVIINVGPYIDKIPEEIIKFCDENDFPLFESPWHVYMAEVMRKFSYEITLSLQSNLELAGIFKNAIFFQDVLELYIPQLKKNNFREEWSYCLAVIEILKEDGVHVIDKKKRTLILKNIENIVTYNHERTFVFESDGRFILVFANYSEEKIKSIVETVKNKCMHLLTKNEKMYFCIGKASKNIKCIAKSHRKALDVLKIQKINDCKNEVTMYSDLGAYKLLLSIDDREIINEYYQETIEPLVKYDQLNGTDYVLVLDTYLKYNGSLKEVATQLFYHRNTINYKLNKIQEILSCDLSELNTRLLLILGLMLRKTM